MWVLAKLVQLSNYRSVRKLVFRTQKNDVICLGSGSQNQHFALEARYLFWWKVENSYNFPPDQLLCLVSLSYLRAALFDSQRTEIDGELIGRFPSFWKWLGLYYGPDPEINLLKIFERGIFHKRKDMSMAFVSR